MEEADGRQMSKGTIFHGHVIAVQDGYYWVESRRRRAAARAQRPPARRSSVRCVFAQPPPRAQLAAASLPAARASKLGLPALDFRGLPWTPLCGPGLGLGLACALGPRRTVEKSPTKKKKKKNRRMPCHQNCATSLVQGVFGLMHTLQLLEPLD